MTITAAQREERRQFLGSSDAAAVLGLSPWRSPWDVWCSKTRRLRDDKSGAARIGDWLEPSIVQEAARRIAGSEQHILEYDLRAIAENTLLAANLDGYRGVEPHGFAPIEAKYRSTRSLPPESGVRSLRDLWGPATGEDDFHSIPLDERCQIMHQMICCGADVGYVAACLCEFELELRIYRVPLASNEKWFQNFESALLNWWQYHIVDGFEPDRQAASWGVVRRVERHEPAIPAKLDDQLFEDVLEAQAASKAAKERHEHAKAQLAAAMGEANYAQGNGFEAQYDKRGALRVKESKLVGID